MYTVLKELCDIHSPSGEEAVMRDYILKYVRDHQDKWAQKPEVICGDEFQDCLMLKFGNPKLAAIAHMDTTGFTVRYQDQLVPIGSPDIEKGDRLSGADSLGLVECGVKIDKDYHVFYDFPRQIAPGTSLTYVKNFEEDRRFIYSPYLDNRAGIFNLLKLAETLQNGILVFSCWEEHGGGSMPFLVKYFYERFKIRQALISDITWITEGVHFDKGVAISMRDRNIPRKSFVDKIIRIAEEYEVKYQVEVEGSGSSDGREIQTSPYPIDWCFVGAPEEGSHSSREKLCKNDLVSMMSLYKILFDAM